MSERGGDEASRDDNWFRHLRESAQRILAEGYRSGIGGPQRDEILEGIDREIGTVLSHIESLDSERVRVQTRMTYHECAIGSELLQMEESNGRWWYGPNRMERWRDQQRLRAERVTMESQHTRLRNQFEQQSRDLESKLLTLLNRRVVLSETELPLPGPPGEGDRAAVHGPLRLSRRAAIAPRSGCSPTDWQKRRPSRSV